MQGSSPTPGVSDVGSSLKTNKNKQTEFVFKTKSRMNTVLQKSQIKNNLSSSSNIEELEKKIDSNTNGLSRPYFNKILKELAKKNLENAIIICDYIIAEQWQYIIITTNIKLLKLLDITFSIVSFYCLIF